jgi:hypothetical protein
LNYLVFRITIGLVSDKKVRNSGSAKNRRRLAAAGRVGSREGTASRLGNEFPGYRGMLQPGLSTALDEDRHGVFAFRATMTYESQHGNDTLPSPHQSKLLAFFDHLVGDRG